MFSSLVITLREGVEGALAIAIVLLYLRKTGRQHLAGAVWWGLGIALAASIAGAYVLQRIALNGEIFEGILMFAAAAFVSTMIVWMWKSARGLKKEIEEKIEVIAVRQEAGATGVWWGIFFFVFLMIFREGIETVIFLSAVTLTTNALLSFFGGVVGLLLATLFGIFLVRGSLRIDLGRFFKVTGIVLMLFVVQLVIGGIHELSEGGLIDIGPRGMAVVGPIVKNNALFLIGVLMIPALYLVIPGRAKAMVETSSAAEKRLHLAQQRRQMIWRTSTAALSLLIVVFITLDFVYGQTRTLSDPVAVTPVDGKIEIAMATVSDGNLHRFIVPDSGVRFILMKTDKIYVAFDACEICGSQGYVQEAGAIICLNCAADINPATIGQGGGCNPIPLSSSQVGNTVVIDLKDLKQQESIFHSGAVHSH
ncbi:Fe-S-containing protein [bacterium]|nr:Fe-S-containing protein [bacterium]MCI0601850.1 Fe-S-containing protein [bacterium]